MNTARPGDVVLLENTLGVVRSKKGNQFSVEVKGKSGSNNIMVVADSVLRIISSEELLHKVASLWGILQGEDCSIHFVSRAMHEQTLRDNAFLQKQIDQIQSECEALHMTIKELNKENERVNHENAMLSRGMYISSKI